jgi:itaconate CoA-transferase
VVQNLRPGAMARMGLAPEALRRENPRLVTCSISGYGEAGPMAERKAYDLLVQADSGLASITGGPEGPARVGVSVVDIATGATAYAAVLEALIRRGITGEGVDIQVSMFDVMAEWLTVPLLNAEAGRPPQRIGLAHPSIAPYGAFASGDGAVFLISIQSEREWVAFCRDFLGALDLPADPRFATNVARVRHRAETDARVAAAFARRSRAEAEAALLRAGTAFAAVNDMDGLSRHPHLRRIEVRTPAGPVAYPAPAPIFGDGARSYGPVPEIGSAPGG